MKKKNLVIIGVVMTIALMAAGIFSACEMEVAEEETKKPIIAPYISVPPSSASYYVGVDTVKDLQAQVWNWDIKDGALSYQWYYFDDIAEYTANNGGTPIPGASGPIDPNDAYQTIDEVMVNIITLSLAEVEASAGKRYYYYLEIQNHDSSATGAKDSLVRSGIATISFNASGQAVFPLITRQPTGSSYQFGRSLVLAELTVRATAPDSGELSYQWYYNTSGSIDMDELTPIEGAVEPAYRPSIELLSPGNNYFFVEITNTLGGDPDNTATQLSVPAVIDMEPGETALQPVIITQPLDKLYFDGDEIQPLTVQAEEPSLDGGIITYQWYSNTTSQARNGRVISGATENSFTPPITAAGTYYYYAIVTNTNQSVKSRTKTTTANTHVVKVILAAPGASGAANAIVTVRDPRLAVNRFQYVRGYGGMDVAWANFPEQKPADMETMYNPDWGLGYNMNRIMISPANTNVNISIRDLINSHRPNYYENVKIVNKYGGYNLASPWSPPKEWKTNNSINGGGDLIHDYYQLFADYLRAFAKHMYDAGAPIYSISISNEPNYTAGYDGCEWTPEQMRDFYKTVTPQPFTRGIRGYGGGRETERVLTMNGESANTPYINEAALRDDVSRANIDVLARHVYGETTKTLWRRTMSGGDISLSIASNIAAIIGADGILHRGDGTMYEVWMTEHNINSANATAYPNDSTWNYVWRFMNDVDLVMRMNNENAFVWWASKRFYSMVGDGQFGTRDGAPLPRGYGLSHYAKYTIDTHRINTTITGTFANGTAIGTVNGPSSSINNTSFDLDNLAVRITAYAHIASGSDNKPITQFVTDGPNPDGFDEIEYISLVMWAPTSTRGQNGRNLGSVEIKMPDGFLIGGVSAHKSISERSMFQPEDVQISSDRTSAFVTLGTGEILSVKLTRQ